MQFISMDSINPEYAVELFTSETWRSKRKREKTETLEVAHRNKLVLVRIGHV